MVSPHRKWQLIDLASDDAAIRDFFKKEVTWILHSIDRVTETDAVGWSVRGTWDRVNSASDFANQQVVKADVDHVVNMLTLRARLD